MKTIRVDDRNTEQLKTHTILITATDKCLSNWGNVCPGASKCAWACKDWDTADKMYNWVNNRSDMKYVNINTSKWYPKASHVHIYVVNDSHPALK